MFWQEELNELEREEDRQRKILEQQARNQQISSQYVKAGQYKPSVLEQVAFSTLPFENIDKFDNSQKVSLAELIRGSHTGTEDVKKRASRTNYVDGGFKSPRAFFTGLYASV
ncbi:hypothetical protein [Bartonella sp. B41]